MPDSSKPHSERRRGQLYGRRKGPKLSAHQSGLLETLLPQLQLNLRAGADPRSYFLPPPRGEVDPAKRSEDGSGGGRPSKSAPHPARKCSPTSPQGGGNFIADVWFEIGFGAGEHLHWQAGHHPNIGMIGAEPFVNGVAKLLSKIESGADNIRIHMGDARDIIEALPDQCIGRVFILFPDPWPKTRHHKRRFVQTDMLDTLARVMKPGAELRFATDDAPYLEWALERLTAHPSFKWTAQCARDWKARTEDWPQTRYEAKQLHGVPSFLRCVRV